MSENHNIHISPARYPIGIQSFETIRTRDYLYIDKTALLYQLAHEGMYYFLSRPRRFGKSLMLSTLRAYFEGRRELFDGLAISNLEQHWTKHPVIYISLATGAHSSLSDTRAILNDQLNLNAEALGIELPDNILAVRFSQLIRRAADRFDSKVVILVDEYDKPLLDTQHADSELHKAIHHELRGFYSCIKDRGDDIRFAMITGVTKFAHLNIFSGLNNLNDISLDDAYNALCGISQSEIDRYFTHDIEALARSLDYTAGQVRTIIKELYDGYHFSARGEDIYNPFSLLNAFSKSRFDTYWYQSGNSLHLVESLASQPSFNYENLEGYVATAEEMMDPNLSYTHPIALLYQTGFLTIKGYADSIYTLGFPNREVSNGFAVNLMAAISPRESANSSFSATLLVKYALTGQADEMMKMFDAGLRSFKYNQLEKPRRELHFHLMLHIMSMCAGLRVESEVHTVGGRIDMVIKTRNFIYIIEFKQDRSVADAMAQLRTKDYAAKYALDPRKLIQIGANFSTATRLLTGWEVME